MNRYIIKIYHDPSNRVAEFKNFEFEDKESAREWGEQVSYAIYGGKDGCEAKVSVEWLSRVRTGG